MITSSARDYTIFAAIPHVDDKPVNIDRLDVTGFEDEPPRMRLNYALSRRYPNKQIKVRLVMTHNCLTATECVRLVEKLESQGVLPLAGSAIERTRYREGNWTVLEGGLAEDERALAKTTEKRDEPNESKSTAADDTGGPITG